MNRHKLRTGDYLEHIIQATERIAHYTVDLDEAAFLINELVQDAVIRNIEIIGEAANNLKKADPEFTDKERYRQRVVQNLTRRARQLGFQLTPQGISSA